MVRKIVHVDTDNVSKGLRVIADDQGTQILHAMWVRERTKDPDMFDPVNRQRLYEPSLLDSGIGIKTAVISEPGFMTVRFTDGYSCTLSLEQIERELGWLEDPEEPPQAVAWGMNLEDRPHAAWHALDDPGVMRGLLDGFFKYGFCLLTDTDRTPGNLERIAKRFGYLRETNFGPLFDVFTKPDPIDLAYTGRGLSAHADNPYRRPIPGIQFLHCLESTVEGGDSTLVDGMAIAERLCSEMPEAFDVLTRTPVWFRYESERSIMQSKGPILEYGADGRFACIRFSSRVDYVPALEPKAMDLFYAGRRRLFELAHDPAFEIRFRLEPGMVLMMDNHRLLHGRTAFDSASGKRHLQGCYIDHDGPDSLYRVLSRDGHSVNVGREVA